MSCNQEMIKIIEVLNKLQDKLVTLGVNDLVKELPQIAVVGSQSAGKSSVLESFVGRDFLPRGSDVVTRRPLILQLKQNTDDERTFAKFNHSEEEFTDFDDIRREIQEETDRTVPDSAISSDPIRLMITSPDVLDLNLIDLPGMTKVPVGKQPDNIEIIVKDLINSFIKSENCIILAVTPANQDLSTSDAIKLAREADPDGNRTIGVLTKLDLMDKGTDARKILMNQHKIRLRRGFIGVVCRSLKDIENKKKLSEAIADEKAFFAEHPAYHDIMHRLGIQYLQKYLQNELADHLFNELPTFRNKFQESLYYLNERIEKISIEKIREMNANELISKTTQQFSESFCNEIGTGDDVPTDRKNFGTNINVEMNLKYAEALEAIVHDQKRIKREIGVAIVNIFGTQLQLFVPNKAFNIVVRKQLELMRPASIRCVDNVFGELESIVRNSAKEIGKFPILSEMYANTTLEFLRQCKKKCREMVDHKLDTEKSYLSATHVDFIKSINLEKQKSFPIAEKVIEDAVEERQVKSGWITHKGQRYYFTIQDQYLHWYDNEYKSRYRGQINLSGAQLSLFGKQCIIKNKNQKIELHFDSKQSAVEWVSALVDNTYEDIQNKEKDEVDSDDDPDNNKYPLNINSQVEEVKKLVLAYIKLMEQTLKDTLPKLCQKELIDATQQFVGETLRNRIQNKGLTIDDLVDADPNEEERKNLIKRQSLYEDALQAMNEAMKSSIGLKA